MAEEPLPGDVRRGNSAEAEAPLPGDVQDTTDGLSFLIGCEQQKASGMLILTSYLPPIMGLVTFRVG